MLNASVSYTASYASMRNEITGDNKFIWHALHCVWMQMVKPLTVGINKNPNETDSVTDGEELEIRH